MSARLEGRVGGAGRRRVGLMLSASGFAVALSLATPLAASAQEQGAPVEPVPAPAATDVQAAKPAQAPASNSVNKEPIPERQGSTVETVTVTARKREERLIDVPIAATVLGRQTLEKYATTDLTQLQVIAPGIEIARTGGGSPGSTIRIRGIGVFGPDYASEQPVSVVVDGVPVTRGHLIDAGFFDQADIQVLKGPQALFFGKNSPAGVVAIDSVSPGRRFEGYGRVSYGFNTEDPIVEGAVSIPLGDKLSVRIALRGEDMQGGYITNGAKPLAVNPVKDPIFGGNPAPLSGANFDKFPQTKEALGRITLVWKPVDNFDATFKYLDSYFHTNASFGGEAIVNCAGANPLYTAALGGTYVDTNATCGFRAVTNDATPPDAVLKNFYGAPADGKFYTETRNTLLSLTMNYRLPQVTFTSVTGYYKLKAGEFDNYDLTVFAETPDYQLEKTKQFTQEIRAATTFDFPVNVTAGAFYEHENRNLFNTNRIFLLPQLPANTPNQEAFAGVSNSMIGSDQNFAEDYSFFAQASWKILPNLELAGGGRYTNAHKHADLTQLMQALDVVIRGLGLDPAKASSLTPAGTVYHVSTSYEDFSPEVTLSWHPIKNVLVYAAYKTGFLAGGIANPGVVSNYTQLSQAVITNNLSFGPESTEGEELGVKGTFLDGRLTGDLTYFRYEYSGLQIATFHPDTTTFTIGNAASALDEGAELNANFRLTDQLSLRGSITYVKLTYEDYKNAPCFPGEKVDKYCTVRNGNPKDVEQDLSGEVFGSSPITTNFGFTYDMPLLGKYDLNVGADVQYYSRAPRLNRQPQTNNPAHTVANAQARLSQINGPWAVSLIGTNLSDEIYANVIGGKPLGATQDLGGVINPGREIRLQLDYKF